MWLDSYVCRSYRGKTDRGGAFPPILNRFKQNSQSNYKQKIHGVFCRKNIYFRNASFKGASPRTTLKSIKDICDKICRNKTQMKVPLKLFAIICFWLYYFGSIKSANLQIFKISTKTIKFLFRWSYMKKDHLNTKVLNSHEINFHLLHICWHSAAVVFVLSTTSFCCNFFSFHWFKKKLFEVVMNSPPIKSSWLNEIIFPLISWTKFKKIVFH